MLPFDKNLQLPDDAHRATHDFIIERQVSRRTLVGSTTANTPIIEDSYRNVLDILQAHLAQREFLFGDRPGRSDLSMSGVLR